jgi:hypothetical protein
VVGVLPETHRTLIGFGFTPDVYMPHYLKTGELAIYARLKAGQSREAALSAVQTVGSRLDSELPEKYFKYAQDCRIEPISGLARLVRQQEVRQRACFS